MSKEFTKQLEQFNKAFESLAHLEESGFNALTITKRDNESSIYAAFGDDEVQTVSMLFNAFVTKVKELEDIDNIPDLILTLIIVLDMDISDDFIQAVHNLAAKSSQTTIK